MNQEKKFTKVQELVYELKVSDAMTQKVITVEPQMMMSALREILRANRIAGAPVVDCGKLVGVISIEDFIKWLADEKKDCPISEKMTTKIKTLYADEPLVHAVSKLEEFGFGRMPVIDRQNDKLMGVITKGDIIEKLLQELEIDYHEEEIHRYRASHIFEDIVADKATLKFQYWIKGKDFKHAGEGSSGLKKTLKRLGLHPHIIRRVAIASYEAEMNTIIYAEKGEMTAEVDPDKIRIIFDDAGPGIVDLEKALQPGYSTAEEWVREMGFGAGMGLPNIKKCSDDMQLSSVVGKGTHLEININLAVNAKGAENESS